MTRNKRYSVNQTKTRSKCKVCTSEIVSSDEEDLSLQCDMCNQWIHLKCSKINRKKFDALNSNEDAPFH